MTAIAVVPVQRLESAKSRLAGSLSPHARQELVQRLLGHMLTTLNGSPGISRSIVVTPDPRIITMAEAHGASGLLQPGDGLNTAIRLGRDDALRAGATTLLILLGDLPLLASKDVAAMLKVAETAAVVLAPDRHGSGTNALVLRPPDVIDPAFGPGSLHAHRSAAQVRGLTTREYRALGTGFDIDTEADLADFVQRTAGSLEDFLVS